MFLHDCGQENVPIVLQSGVKDLARVAAAVQTPYFVSKPYTFDELRGVLDRALQERVVPHQAAR